MRKWKLRNCENTVFDGKGVSIKKHLIDLKDDLHNTEMSTRPAGINQILTKLATKLVIK
jgi:hypothetical protein